MKALLTAFLFISVLVPNTALAQAPDCTTGFTPLLCPIVSGSAKCNSILNDKGCFEDPCTTCHLLSLAGHILADLIAIAVLLAVILFVYAGWILLTTPITDQISRAKRIFWNTAFGLIVILASWLVVDTILSVAASGGKRLNGATFDAYFCTDSTNTDAFKLCQAQGFETVPSRTAGPASALPLGTPVSLSGVPISCSGSLCSSVATLGLQVASVCRNGCVVRADVGERLQVFNEALGVERSIWTTTSAFETGHVNNCHTTHATCIDFAPSAHVPTGETVNNVINIANANGLRAEWEVGTTAQRDAFIAQGVPADRILVVVRTDGTPVNPHFSVYCAATGGARDNDCNGTPSLND